MSLLIRDHLVEVPGLAIVPPASHGGPAFCQLGADDYAMRKTDHPSQIIVHTTGGHWPQPILPGAGAAGHARQILDMWRGADRGGGERIHSAAPLTIDFDGTIYCAGDLVYAAPFHAEGSNPRSVGIEMCTTPRGGLYQATIDACVRLLAALTWSGAPVNALLPIPWQFHALAYRSAPLARMETGAGKLYPVGTRRQLGGPDCAGIFGHRDNTSERGRGDPGDAIYEALLTADAEPLDYSLGYDLQAGRSRQQTLNELDVRAGNTYRPLVVDGVCGPASLAAARRLGFARWDAVPMDE